MLSNKTKPTKIITIILTELICVFSGVVSVSSLFFHEIPLKYQMLGSFYSSMLMVDIGEWIPEAKEFIEYFWITVTLFYLIGKIIFVAAVGFITAKKTVIGLIIPICIVFLVDIPAWLDTAAHINILYYGNLIGWATAGAVIRALIIIGYILIVIYKEVISDKKPVLKSKN